MQTAEVGYALELNCPDCKRRLGVFATRELELKEGVRMLSANLGEMAETARRHRMVCASRNVN
jgi:uncharacterized protein YbaR (Trm112 family)